MKQVVALHLIGHLAVDEWILSVLLDQLLKNRLEVNFGIFGQLTERLLVQYLDLLLYRSEA